ncbi:MAG: caspase, EACC1-associated type, partial [Gammaproteobacteria bacterium]
MAKVALLIGVSDYEPGLNSLPSAIKDAEAMRQVLVRPEIGEFSESDITVLTNPDRQNMEEEIERLFSNRHKDDLVLLFFSGHGIKDDTGRLYLATRQTRRTTQGDLIRSSAVAASFIHDNMERSRSKRQVVILDSCFSGAFAVGLSAKDDGNVNIFEQLGGEGRAVLTSSSSTQYSFEQQESDLSVYTKHLIEGIATGAADANDDGFVSIGELHEYARHKVKETYPAMKPEIYPGKEGYTIRLCKVPPGDPKEKYRKEVRRYIGCGDVDFIGRKILDALRNRLGLTEAETKLIEDEILASARQEVHEKLQRYEHDFSDALLQDPPLSEANLDLLRQNLKQILELKTEDIQTIEQQVRTSIETYQRHLNEYEQLFTEAVIKERPLIITTRNRLHEIQQQWKLKSEDITSIEIRVTAERKAHQQKLRQYEKTLRDLARHEYPFSEESYQTLNKEQKQLALTDEDIAQIRLQVKAEIDAYQQNLKDYEQAFKHVLQHEKEITDENREELKRYQAVLELRDEDLARTEAEL